jgi:hypothetical protein
MLVHYFYMVLKIRTITKTKMVVLPIIHYIGISFRLDVVLFYKYNKSNPVFVVEIKNIMLLGVGDRLGKIDSKYVGK